MNDSERILYQQRSSPRNPFMAKSIAICGISAVVLGVASWRLLSSDQLVLGSISLVLAIVFSAVALATSWTYLKNIERELTVSNLGLKVDSQFWPWSEVSRVTFAPSQYAVFINVNNGAMRSTLSHLIQIPATEYSSLEDQLKSTIAEHGIASTVRGKRL